MQAQLLMYDSIPVTLEIRESGKASIRVTVQAGNIKSEIPGTPVLSDKKYPEPAILVTEIQESLKAGVGMFDVNVYTEPLKVAIYNNGRLIQELSFREDGSVSFMLDDKPVLGMGEGGPRMGRRWRNDTIEFDRKGRLHKMEPRWQDNAYGSRNPVAMLIGTGGWGLFVASPWVQVDLTDKTEGVFILRNLPGLEKGVQNRENQQQNAGKGIPPPGSKPRGQFDIFVFETGEPEIFFNDLAEITGRAVMPPKWALGYMQSHRTLEDDKQMIEIVETFREKQIPVDAVIYLGTGFCPRGWNTEQPSFDFNPEVFKREPSEVIADLHDLNVKMVVHMVPWDRDRLPTLHGTIPPWPGEKLDESHIFNYWKQHIALVESGIDGWWPDEGDWFDLFERLKRHQMYYQGPLYTTPDVRPWSLHRNGHLGIAKWGGWMWSGDTQSSWKTLEGQIAVGINHSLSLSPFWGSDIGGFYPNEELDGELYARWFQFGAFCPSFRSHGRTWWTRLPWGWGLSEMGPKENRNNPLESELKNPAIEPVCRKYAELRYRLLSYNYTLAWEARTKGLPLMRAMWVHYPDDKEASGKGDQYLWGKNLLIAPVYKKDASNRIVYLPEGIWYDWWDNQKYRGGTDIERRVDLSTMPIFARAGAIIPFDPVRQYTSQPVDELLELRIYTGADGSFTLYEDDGISLDYLKGEACTLNEISWDDTEKILTIKPSDGETVDSLNGSRKFRLKLLPTGLQKIIKYDGRLLKTEFKTLLRDF
ncbi:MAG: glycoside hydrolase family 31 protein [Bacteroidota bacterium]|nr:glycoside hydrolase family 31 protein [Bacteroidota bacterium]